MHLSGHAKAARAVELVQEGSYADARRLLTSLKDDDFRVPLRREIMDILPDGTAVCEVVQPPAIGNRRLLLAHCQMQLGVHDESLQLAWELLESGCTDQMLMQIFLAADERDHAMVFGGIKRIAGQSPKNQAASLALQYVEVAHGLRIGHFGPAILAIRSGSWNRGPSSELKEWVCRQLAADANGALPHLVEALDGNCESVWLVHCLGLTEDERAVEPLFRHLRIRRTSNWGSAEWAAKALSRIGAPAALYCVKELRSTDPAVRESAAHVLSACSGEDLEAADPGLQGVLAALRDSRNHGDKPYVVNVSTFLLRAIAATRNPAYLEDVLAARAGTASFSTSGDRQWLYTRAYLGDESTVAELIDGIDGKYSHFVIPALQAVTGESFGTREEWRDWWKQRSTRRQPPSKG